MSTYSLGPFTGHNGLTGVTLMMSQAIVLNEIGSLSAYLLYSPPSGAKDGFTFGGLQWDLANHTPLRLSDNPADQARRADVIFADVLRAAVYADDYFDVSLRGQRIFTDAEIDSEAPDSLMNRVRQRGNPNALDPYLARIQLALGSTEGRAIIDADHRNEVGIIQRYVNIVIAGVTNVDDRAFLEGSNVAQVFMADFRNQFSDARNTDLRNYLQGTSVNQGTGRLQKVGRLGLADVLNFYFSTQYAASTTGLNDELRRFNKGTSKNSFFPLAN
jgi:hypothetical protein